MIQTNGKTDSSFPDSAQPTLRQRVLIIQADTNKKGADITHEIIFSDLFAEKFRAAFSVALQTKRLDLLQQEDIAQEALSSIHQYLCAYGISEYADKDEYEFGGWLFVLCRRHIFWALRRFLRKPDFANGMGELLTGNLQIDHNADARRTA